MDALTRLALAARGGDRDALDAFVRSCYEDVLRLCSVLVDGRSAEDVAQESVIRIVRGLPRYRAECPARTWLLAVTRHTCLDEIRARGRRRRHEARPESRSASGGGDASEPAVTSDLLMQLEVDRRTAFVLTQVIGAGYAEAADICGCPVGTIRSRVARARADLIALLDEAPTRAADRSA